MSVNARVMVRQDVPPHIGLRWALHNLRKQVGPTLREVRDRQYFTSESRRRREQARQVVRARVASK